MFAGRSANRSMPEVPHTRIRILHARIVESRGPIYWPNMPIRQDFWADLSANRSERAKWAECNKMQVHMAKLKI